jgi:hypothetical protein
MALQRGVERGHAGRAEDRRRVIPITVLGLPTISPEQSIGGQNGIDWLVKTIRAHCPGGADRMTASD